MKAPHPLILLFFSCFCFLYSSAETTPLEQVKEEMQKAARPQQKLAATLRFCDQWDSYSPDTLKKYALLSKQLAVEQKDVQAILKSDYYFTLWLYQVNKLDTALAAANSLYDRYINSFPYDDMYVKLFALKANILLRIARMSELMDMSFRFIKLAEQHKDTLGMARATLSIGNVNMRMKKYDEALNWYRQALALMHNPVHKRRLSFIYNNIGIVFYHLQKEDSAFHYIKQGLQYSREDANLTNEANALFLYGGMMAEFGHLKEAEEGFKAAIEARKKIGDVYYLINDMAQLALFYANNKSPEKGIALCKQGLELAKNNGLSLANLNDLYEALSRNYQAAGDYKNYSETLNKIIVLKDSTYKVNSAEQMAELQTKYEVQKKETTIIQQKLALAKKNYLVYGSLALIVFALTLALVLFRNYQKRQRMKLEMMLEKEKDLAMQAVAKAEESERKRIAADLHDSLGAYAASIASNIDHLQLTPMDAENSTAIRELRQNSRSIVLQLSDTIWALKKDALSLTAISDRIKVFIQRIQPSYPHIRFDVIESITDDHLLPPSQAFHLFQIVQEAINNAVRHSNCKSVQVNIHGNSGWSLCISDDGTGMNTEHSSGGGNGLQNMQDRAKQAGCNLEWKKGEPTGTKVFIEPTTN
jgi:two-component system, NarL family, sensor kinase